MILLISYDLIAPGQDYSGLYEEIKAADAWWHHLDSTWIISTESGPDEWQKRLRKHMDADDSLLVIQVTNNYQGWLPESAWKWLNRRNWQADTLIADRG